MLDVTKEIIVAMINNGRLIDIEDVKTAIKEIHQEIENTRLTQPEYPSND